MEELVAMTARAVVAHAHVPTQATPVAPPLAGRSQAPKPLKTGIPEHTIAPQPPGLRRMLDLLPLGVMLVDSELRVSVANARAVALLQERDGLWAQRCKLETSSPDTTAKLARLVESAAAARASAGESPCEALLSVERPSGRSAFTLRILACDERAPRWVKGDHAWVFLIEDAPAVAGLPAGLPRRQEQVLRLLLSGEGCKQIAAALDLSPHTVAEYVKILYRRFGVRSRGELMAKFVSTAPSTPSLGFLGAAPMARMSA
jgi:DNA-binding CsgD family transcriptional regulator